MGANGQRNAGSIRPAKWWRNGTKHAASPPKTRSHQPNTACRHWDTYITRKKHLIIYKQINFCFYEKILNFVENNLHMIVGTTQYCDTQQTIHYTTNNTQHKIHSCYIISFETFLAVFEQVVCLSWIGLGTGGSWIVCWQRQKIVVTVRVRCTEPSLHSPHS